ncbi:MAG: DUF4293 domain-containing protein [Bacteroidota bacterium]|nr:DUF4293 domain-containing protein [Bacteroidota bacterium]
MLQRIQTLFLALVCVFMIVFLVVNIWEKQSADGIQKVTLSAFRMIQSENGKSVNEKSVFWLAGLALGAFGISIYSIFQYKKRLVQMQMGMINSLLISAILGLIIYHSFEGEKLIENASKGSFGIGFIIPAIALVANMLAGKFIRNDEDKVRAADRMR